MYVCMYRGCPSWKCPLLRAVQLGHGEGPIRIVAPISQPRGTIDAVSLTLYHTYSFRCKFSDTTLLWVGKGDMHSHVQRGRVASCQPFLSVFQDKNVFQGKLMEMDLRYSSSSRLICCCSSRTEKC